MARTESGLREHVDLGGRRGRVGVRDFLRSGAERPAAVLPALRRIDLAHRSRRVCSACSRAPPRRWDCRRRSPGNRSSTTARDWWRSCFSSNRCSPPARSWTSTGTAAGVELLAIEAGGGVLLGLVLGGITFLFLRTVDDYRALKSCSRSRWSAAGTRLHWMCIRAGPLSGRHVGHPHRQPRTQVRHERKNAPEPGHVLGTHRRGAQRAALRGGGLAGGVAEIPSGLLRCGRS